MARVAVAMSGGVDSSAAAGLLQEPADRGFQGVSVTGVDLITQQLFDPDVDIRAIEGRQPDLDQSAEILQHRLSFELALLMSFGELPDTVDQTADEVPWCQLNLLDQSASSPSRTRVTSPCRKVLRPIRVILKIPPQ